MKRYVLSFMTLLFLMIQSGFGANDAYIISRQAYLKIMPLIQHWGSNNFGISEISIPVSVYYPVNREMSISMRTGQANIQGDVKSLSGLTDTQLGMNYHLEDYNLVLNCGINLPSGKKELTQEELSTSTLLSYNYYNFQVPNFGQGLNISSGATWAKPVKENLVVGLGVSYQFTGGFKPREGMKRPYNPGDEILLTSGLDFRINPTTILTTDLIVTFYTTDKIGNRNVFGSGSKLILNCQFQKYLNSNTIVLIARYRSKAKNSSQIGLHFEKEDKNTNPVQFEGLAAYGFRINQKYYGKVVFEGKSIFKTSYFPGVDIFSLGFWPEMKLSDRYRIPAKISYQFGDFAGGSNISGFELGVGFTWYFLAD
jgi:hypothetical protein